MDSRTPADQYWQLHSNGFFGLRREIPERAGKHRLESLNAFELLGWLAESLVVARNLYADLGPEESIVWQFRADGLRGRYLSADSESETEWLMDRHYRCDAFSYGPKVKVLTLRQMRADIGEVASEVFTDFYTFFDQHLEPDHFVGWLDRFLKDRSGR